MPDEGKALVATVNPVKEPASLTSYGRTTSLSETTKGVDSSHDSTDDIEAAKSLAQSCGAIVVVSGVVDIVTDGHQILGAHNGVPIMQWITATGVQSKP